MKPFVITVAATICAITAAVSTRFIVPAFVLIFRAIEESFAPTPVAPVVVTPAPIAPAKVATVKRKTRSRKAPPKVTALEAKQKLAHAIAVVASVDAPQAETIAAGFGK